MRERLIEALTIAESPLQEILQRITLCRVGELTRNG